MNTWIDWMAAQTGWPVWLAVAIAVLVVGLWALDVAARVLGEARREAWYGDGPLAETDAAMRLAQARDEWREAS